MEASKVFVPVVVALAVVELAGCGRRDPAPAPVPRIVRVEYPNPAGPVEVAAVPLDQITQVCIARAGVIEVRSADNRIGYATATDLPAVNGLGWCRM